MPAEAEKATTVVPGAPASFDRSFSAASGAMRDQGLAVVFDVTHSLQLPGGGDGVTAGQAEYIVPLASAGVAAGVDGVFLEVHEEPSRARSDAQNALRLDKLEPLLHRLLAIDAIAKRAEAPLHG